MYMNVHEPEDAPPETPTEAQLSAAAREIAVGMIGGLAPGMTGLNLAAEVAEKVAAPYAAEVCRLLAAIDEMAAELDGRDEKARKRWIRKQEKQLGIKYADFRTGAWEMDLAMGREMGAAYVAMAKALLGDAPNYTETKLMFDVKIAESPETYTLVVQRHAPGALTPHEARQRAEQQYEVLQAKVESVLLYLAALDTTAMSDDAVALGYTIVPMLDGP